MPLQVNITSITGTPQFNIWVCDTSDITNTCLYIKTTADTSTELKNLNAVNLGIIYKIEYLNIPQEFELASGYCVKIIDSENCQSYRCFGDSN